MAQAKKISDIFVSVVINSIASDRNITKHIKAVHKSANTRYRNFEIVAVLDSGIDQNELLSIKKTLQELHSIRVVLLARRYAADTAVFAGIESSIGDIVCVINPYFHPTSMIEVLVEKNRSADIVIGTSTGALRRSSLHTVTSKAYHNYNKKYLGVDVSPTETYLMSLSRRTVNALTRNKGAIRNLRHLLSITGYKKVTVHYTPLHENELDRGETFFKAAVRSFSTVASFSTRPLRFVTWVGVIGAFFNLLYAAYVVLANLILKKTAEGWTTLSLQASVMFFLIFVILMVVTEYIGVITEDVREGGAPYIIADELVSTITVTDVDRRNITR